MMDFASHWARFLQQGKLLEITRSFERGIETSTSFILESGVTGRLVDSGILTLTPVIKSHDYLLISAGIHGNETAPIEILDQLCQAIIQGKLEVKINLMLMIGNPAAINQGHRFVDQNLNRLFCGKYQTGVNADYESYRAALIESAVEDFFSADKNSNGKQQRMHFDMHTAIRPSKYERFALLPFLDGRPINKDFVSLFAGAEIQTLLLGHQPAGTFSYYTSHRFKADAATLELGKVHPFGKNDQQKFLPIKTNLERLISGKPANKKAFDYQTYRVFRVKDEVIKLSQDYQLLLDDDVENFTAFKQGEILASDHQGQEYRVAKEGDAIVFPNNKVPVGQRMAVVIERLMGE